MAEEIALGKLIDKQGLQSLLDKHAKLGGESIQLWVVDDKGETLASHPAKTAHRDFSSLWKQVQQQREPAVTSTQVAVPIIVDRALVGALVGSPTEGDPCFLTPFLEGLAEMLSMIIGAELEKRALAQELIHRYSEINLLYSIGETIGASLNLEEVTRLVLEQSGRIIGASKGAVVLIDEEKERLDTKASYDLQEEEQKSVLEAAEEVLRTHEPEIVERMMPLEIGNEITSLLAVPLETKNKALGAIVLANKRPAGIFTASDSKLLMALSRQAATAIENARLYTTTDQELTSRLGELYILQEIDRQLNATLDFQQVLDLTLEWALQSTEARAGIIAVIDPEQGTRILSNRGYQVDWGMFASKPEWFEKGVISRVLQMGEPIIVADVTQEPDYVKIAEGIRSQLTVPLLRERKPVGIIHLESSMPDAFDQEDLQFIIRLADHAMVAIENARLYESVRRANEAKGEFVSTVAHELKAPMTAIKGFVYLLRRGETGLINDKQREYLNVIEANVNRMGTLISDLLDIAHLEAGVMQMAMRPVAISEVITDVVQSLSDQMNAKRQVLTCHIPDSLPLVWGDPARLGQVLTNLVSNACKYTPEGGKIEIGVNEASGLDKGRAGRCLVITVQDTGIGISEADQGKLFSKFFRADHPVVRETDGTGLGLSIVKRIVDLHGGDIWVESVFGQGSSFNFSIPLASQHEEDERATAK